MYTLFVILIVIAALLMIGIVLIQESKGGGLASNFASYNQIGGVRKTWGLAIAMVIISIVCAYVAPKQTVGRSVTEGIEAPAANPNNLPGFDASQKKDVAAPAATEAPAPAETPAPAN